jgi:hypothetical protein
MAGWREANWSQADETYQQGLDLAKEEAAEAKLEEERERMETRAAKAAAAVVVAQIKEAQLLQAEKRYHTHETQIPFGGTLRTVGSNPIMESRILGRFPPGAMVGHGLPAEKFGDMVQLLRDKEAQIAQQSLHIEDLLRELHGVKGAYADEFRDACAAGAKFSRALEVISLMCPFVEKIRDETNSRSELDACKAALEAYGELGNDQGPAAARFDAVGHAEVRHIADCQDERPAGVAGGEPPRPTEGQDRAASAVRASAIRQDPDGRHYERRYFGPGDAVPSGVMIHTGEDRRLYWKKAWITPSSCKKDTVNT